MRCKLAAGAPPPMLSSFVSFRFFMWIKTFDSVAIKMDANAWIEQYLPPLDVLMVWHAYLLNPK